MSLLLYTFQYPFPNRYVVGEDGLRRLQTVRLDDNNVATATSDRGGGSTMPTSNHGDEAPPIHDGETVIDSQETLN